MKKTLILLSMLAFALLSGCKGAESYATVQNETPKAENQSEAVAQEEKEPPATEKTAPKKDAPTQKKEQKREQKKDNSTLTPPSQSPPTGEAQPKEEAQPQKEEPKKEEQPQKNGDEITLTLKIKTPDGEPFSGDVNAKQGDSVLVILKSVCDKNGIAYKAKGGYISMLAGVKEFDHGALSGWQFYINGERAARGAADVKPKDGDRIEWRYATDFTKG